MDGYSEFREYLEKFDQELGEADLQLTGVLIGQTALWEYAEQQDEEITKRETEDIDIYAPNVEEVFEVADLYNEAPQHAGIRVDLDRSEDGKVDLMWNHEMSEEFVSYLDEENEKIQYLDNIDLYMLPKDTYKRSKKNAGRSKDKEDLEELEKLMA